MPQQQRAGGKNVVKRVRKSKKGAKDDDVIFICQFQPPSGQVRVSQPPGTIVETRKRKRAQQMERETRKSKRAQQVERNTRKRKRAQQMERETRKRKRTHQVESETENHREQAGYVSRSDNRKAIMYKNNVGGIAYLGWCPAPGDDTLFFDQVDNWVETIEQNIQQRAEDERMEREENAELEV